MAFRWMCRAMALGWLLIALAISGCWKTPANFCCVGDDCDKHHVGETPCGDGFVCSQVDGFRNSCVPREDQPCTGPADCPMPGLPACVDNQCVACDGTLGCTTPEAPTCDLTMNACATCTTESECARFPETPHCGGAAGCVECRPDAETSDCTTATAPVCDEDSSMCRGCQAHDECASTVCDLGTGQCVAESAIAYVATTGVDSAPCTLTQRCRTITRALAALGPAKRTILLAAGEYGVPGADNMGTETVAITASAATRFVLLGQGNVGLARTTAGPLLQISGLAEVTLEGIRLHDALGADVGDGIRCVPTDGNAPTLVLRRMTVELNGGQGVDSTECKVTIERSTIARNFGGGVTISNGTFAITNSFLVRNGGTGSLVGGALLTSATAGANQFAFNTVSDNLSVDGQAGGVQCAAIGLTATSNIVWSNDSQLASQVSGNCTWAYSDIGPQDPVQAGTQNVSREPSFVAPLQTNYHLQTTSMVRELGDPATTLELDFDGDPRKNGLPDIGADEVTP
jgi:hypothetical protein